jgi:PIN domain nuclease of toxin-antitoxin system
VTVLLDTHTVLWWLADDDRLPDSARETIKNAGEAAYVSAASVWEIAIKRELGKLEITDDWYSSILQDFAALPMSAEHARRAGELPTHHRDPFDRMLVAQALTENLTLVAADPAFALYGAAVSW